MRSGPFAGVGRRVGAVAIGVLHVGDFRIDDRQQSIESVLGGRGCSRVAQVGCVPLGVLAESIRPHLNDPVGSAEAPDDRMTYRPLDVHPPQVLLLRRYDERVERPAGLAGRARAVDVDSERRHDGRGGGMIHCYLIRLAAAKPVATSGDTIGLMGAFNALFPVQGPFNALFAPGDQPSPAPFNALFPRFGVSR